MRPAGEVLGLVRVEGVVIVDKVVAGGVGAHRVREVERVEGAAAASSVGDVDDPAARVGAGGVEGHAVDLEACGEDAELVGGGVVVPGVLAEALRGHHPVLEARRHVDAVHDRLRGLVVLVEERVDEQRVLRVGEMGGVGQGADAALELHVVGAEALLQASLHRLARRRLRHPHQVPREHALVDHAERPALGAAPVAAPAVADHAHLAEALPGTVDALAVREAMAGFGLGLVAGLALLVHAAVQLLEPEVHELQDLVLRPRRVPVPDLRHRAREPLALLEGRVVEEVELGAEGQGAAENAFGAVVFCAAQRLGVVVGVMPLQHAVHVELGRLLGKVHREGHMVPHPRLVAQLRAAADNAVPPRGTLVGAAAARRHEEFVGGRTLGAGAVTSGERNVVDRVAHEPVAVRGVVIVVGIKAIPELPSVRATVELGFRVEVLDP
mmetsp:Transcript_15465/g.36771  ORF Transcript_15465/g.36771 Transcript_15465/m.36771 type:complete len:440 (+) Transcript_15465:614-1933(+)